MNPDLVIRGGTVVDGTGAAPVVADVAVADGIVTAVGQVQAAGTREIDASGHIVTPGFVDIHSHLDAQVGWDPLLTPSSSHGITTALLGNCGVTFAPCRPSDRGMLAGMMESVEDIPADAILGGLPWNWETYGEYLDSVESLEPAINLVGLVGHCALRPYVMGERGVEGAPTPEEQSTMARVVREAVDAGAAGFSTSRFPYHFLPDGRNVPGTHADHDELVAFAEAIGPDGVSQVVPNFLDIGNEFALLRRLADAAGGHVLFSTGVTNSRGSGRAMAEAVDRLRDDGCRVTGLCIPRASGLIIGLVNQLYFRGASWKRLGAMDLHGRLAAIGDQAFFDQLVADAAANPTTASADAIYPLGLDSPRYTDGPEHSLQALADAAGEHPAATFLRTSLETEGTALFTVRFFNGSLDAVEALITSDGVLPGLGDAGAHVGQIMDAGWTTFVLRHWARDRGSFTIQEAVRRLTSAPAEVVGLDDRGTLAVGRPADVNVIDLDRLADHVPEFVHDFPGGAGRFVQRATGYAATVCNGEIIVRDDQHTGVRPGQVLRS